MLKLAAVDPASSGDHHVQDKPVFVKRKRAAEESSSSEEDDDNEIEEDAEEGEEVVDEPTEAPPKKSSGKGKKQLSGAASAPPQQAAKRKKNSGADLRPIYEDYLTESDLENTVERLLQTYFAKLGVLSKNSEAVQQSSPQAAAASKKPSQQAVAAAAARSAKAGKESADRRALLQLSKSFDVLQKKLSKVLSDAS